MKNKLKAKLSCLITLSLLFSLIPIKSQAATEPDRDTRYSVSIAPNFAKPSYSAKVFKEEEPNNYLREYKIAPYSRLSKIPYTIPSTVPTKVGTSTDVLSSVTGKQGDWEIQNHFTDGFNFSDNGKPYFSFPRYSMDADSKDKKEAERVGNELVAGLNDAMALIVKESGYEWPSDQQERVEAFFKLTAALGNINASNTEFEFNGIKFKAEFSMKDDTKVLFSIVSGPRTGELLSGQYKNKIDFYEDLDKESDDYKKRAYGNSKKDTKLGTLSWNHIVYFGNASYIVEGLTSNNQAYEIGKLESDDKPDLFERLLADVITNVMNVIREWFDLESIEGLMLGKTDFYTWNGIAPIEWLKASSVIFWIMQVIAWIILLGAVVKLFTSNLINTMNLSTRARLLEGVSDILIAALLLAMIFPVFEILVTFNTQLIDIMRDLTNTNVDLLADKGGTMRMLIESKGGLAGALTGIFYLFMEIYFNAVFILRGFTVCLLFGLAPAFVVCYAFGGRWKSLTFRYAKEVIGNIYIGTFYAIAMTFFGLFLFTSGGVKDESVLVGLVLIWGFIPMTKIFKELTGIGESSFISQTASTAQNKIEGWGNRYIKEPAQRMGKGAIEGGAALYKSSRNAKALHKQREVERDERNAQGENCRLSDYEKASAGDVLKGTTMKALGDAFKIKPLQREGLNILENASKPGEIKNNASGDGKVTMGKENEGTGYKQSVMNEKNNVEHTFDLNKLKEKGIIDTKKTGDGRFVEQTYNEDFVKNNLQFFEALKERCGEDGMADAKLRAEGLHGYREVVDENGNKNVVVSYDTSKLDIKNVRNNGENSMIVERATTTTKATADFTEQISSLNQATEKVNEAATKVSEEATKTDTSTPNVSNFDTSNIPNQPK